MDLLLLEMNLMSRVVTIIVLGSVVLHYHPLSVIPKLGAIFVVVYPLALH
jgi:hypothetical protein